MEEIWADLPDYIGYYQISNMGRVKSVTRVVKCDRGPRTHKGKILKPHVHSLGYLKIKLSKQGNGKEFYVHRLVAITFIKNSKNLTEVNHINRIRTDNRVENLEWVNSRENKSYTYLGRRKSNYVGVSWYKPTERWVSHIAINRKSITLGYYHDELEARDAYVNALVDYGLENKYAQEDQKEREATGDSTGVS